VHQVRQVRRVRQVLGAAALRASVHQRTRGT
jgi:hypothetical protein